MTASKCAIIIIITLGLANVSLADDDPSGGRYCGVYSLYAALKALDRDCSLERLIDERYVSSSLGSTLADLKQASDDCQVFALPMSGMTTGMLRDSEWPILVHVRTARRGSPFLHWIVYLGMEGDRAQIIDPPNALEVVSFAEILARWDGVGMIISTEPVSRIRASRVAWLEQGIVAASSLIAVLLAFGGVFLVLPVKRRNISIGFVMIITIAGALAICHHGLMSDGFLHNRYAVAAVMTAHHAKHLREVSLEEFQRAISQRRPVILDARFSSDYARDHIPNAVAIPISTDPLPEN